MTAAAIVIWEMIQDVNDHREIPLDEPIPYDVTEPVNPAPRAAVLHALDVEPALVEEDTWLNLLTVIDQVIFDATGAKALAATSPAMAADLLIQALDRALAALQP